MTKSIPDKCKKCAMLSAAQAQALHGNIGDRCWNPAVCYSRRSYARHRDRRNLIRSRQRVDTDQDLVVNIDEFASIFWVMRSLFKSGKGRKSLRRFHRFIVRGWLRPKCILMSRKY